MDTNILPREALSDQARAAVRESVRTGLAPRNPYPAGSDAAKSFDCYLSRWMAADEDEGATA